MRLLSILFMEALVWASPRQQSALKLPTRADDPQASPAPLSPSFVAPISNPHSLERAVKLEVDHLGVYRVTGAQLVGAGLPANVDPRRLQLFTREGEQALFVTGAEDGVLDSTDGIEFFGIGDDTPFSGTRTYWLVEDALGKRVNSLGAQAAVVSDGAFAQRFERADRNLNFVALHNGEADNFFGPVITATPAQQTLTVEKLASSGSVMLEVALQGVSIDNHDVVIALNGAEVGHIAWYGRTSAAGSFPLTQSALVDGANTLTATATLGDTDVSLIDQISLTYPHRYAAMSDRLKFTVAAGQSVTVRDFSSALVRVFDITGAPVELFGSISADGNTFALSLAAASQERTLYAFTSLETPAVVAHPAKWLADPSQEADLVIVGPAAFLPSVMPLVAQRQSEGYRVRVVDVADVYDEFNWGQKSPHALREFLRASQSWQKAPRFVLLVGDASFDPRNRLGLGNFDFVPTKIVDTRNIETASDEWLVDFDGDEYGELAIGRFPARTAAEVDHMVARTLAHRPFDDRTNARVLLVGGSDPEYDFTELFPQLEAYAQSQHLSKIVRGVSDDDATRAAIKSQLEGGLAIMNYFGHGSSEMWDGEIFSSDQAYDLAVPPRAPISILTTCLNGFFQDVYTESLAEALLKAEGGSVATWASSTLAYADPQAAANAELYYQLFENRVTLGEATRLAKHATSDIDTIRSYILFGDPTLPVYSLRSALPSDPGRTPDPLPVEPEMPKDVPAGCTCDFSRASSSAPSGFLFAFVVLVWVRRARLRRAHR